jgi:VWFA-related protein
MTKQRWLLPALILAGVGSLIASYQAPIFHVNTQLVEVDVVVHGKNGPIAGLTQDDFTILDNGKPQKISLFSVQSSAASKSLVSSATPSSAPKASPLAPGVVSNRLTSSGEEPPSPTVILWDALNTETSDQAWVRNQVIRYLASLHPGDPIAVYILVKNLHVIQDFTTDSTALITALSKTNAEQSADLSAPDLTDLQSQINFLSGVPANAPAALAQAAASLAQLQTVAVTAAKEMTDYALRDQLYITQAALESIAEHLSGLPGRKKLVWISGSFPALTMSQRNHGGVSQIEILDFSPQLYHAIRALNGANVAVYPIDPRGITTSFDAPSTRPSISTPRNAYAAKMPDGDLTAPGIDTMNLLAGGTGGRSFYATNDAVGAMKTIMEDGEVTYRLGFYPSDEKLDGSYHTLSVKVARKTSGIEDVRARKGYFALDASNSANGRWRDRVNESMRDPLDATELGLRASATPIKNTPGAYQLELVLDLDGLHFERAANGRWEAGIALATQFGPSDSPIGSLETIRLSLTEDRLKEALKNGYSLRRKLAAGSSTGELHIVVEDAATGALGSVHVPVSQAQ